MLLTLLQGIIPVSLVPNQHPPEHMRNREMTLTVMNLIAVVLQALDVPFFQHPVSHQQLQEAPVDVGHGACSSGTALHVYRS